MVTFLFGVTVGILATIAFAAWVHVRQERQKAARFEAAVASAEAAHPAYPRPGDRPTFTAHPKDVH